MIIKYVFFDSRARFGLQGRQTTDPAMFAFITWRPLRLSAALRDPMITHTGSATGKCYLKDFQRKFVGPVPKSIASMIGRLLVKASKNCGVWAATSLCNGNGATKLSVYYLLIDARLCGECPPTCSFTLIPFFECLRFSGEYCEYSANKSLLPPSPWIKRFLHIFILY